MRFLRLFLCIILWLCFSNALLAQKTSDKSGMEEERRSLQRELREIQQTYDAVKGQTNLNMNQLAALSKKVELQEKYINNLGKEIHLIDDDIYYSAIEIGRLKKQLDTLKSQYAHTVVYAYKNRSNYDYLNFIFSASNFNDALRRIAYLKSYRNYRQKQMGGILKTRDLIAARYDYQVGTKKKKENVLSERSGEYTTLEQQRIEKDSVVKILRSQAGDLQAQIAKKQQQDKQLKSSIAAIVRKEIADAKRIAQEELKKQRADALARQAALEEQRRQEALATARMKDISAPAPANPAPVIPNTEQPVAEANKPLVINKPTRVDAAPSASGRALNVNGLPTINAHNKSIAPARLATTNTGAAAATKPENKEPVGGYLNYQATDIALNSNFAQNKGRLPYPVDKGVVTLGFGRYKIEGVGPDVVGDNPGITFAAPQGSPVKAVFDGEVVSISSVGGMSFVVLRHGKYFTAYSNLGSVSVSKGATVRSGQTIGAVGADEETGGGKLDFILMIEERNVDPRGWLR